jgi:2'-5' RNA ligase
MTTIRTFICIELPPTLKKRIEILQSELCTYGSGVSWVKPENIHLTLRFLGDVDLVAQPKLTEAIGKAVRGFHPFKIAVTATGAFPNFRNPRVFWIGIDDLADCLIPLQRKIEEELVQAGFGKEDKRFSPHLTIGRVRQAKVEKLGEMLKNSKVAREELTVEEIIIMSSDLRPTGPVYAKQAVIRLEA